MAIFTSCELTNNPSEFQNSLLGVWQTKYLIEYDSICVTTFKSAIDSTVDSVYFDTIYTTDCLQFDFTTMTVSESGIFLTGTYLQDKYHYVKKSDSLLFTKDSFPDFHACAYIKIISDDTLLLENIWRIPIIDLPRHTDPNQTYPVTTSKITFQKILFVMYKK